MNDYSSEGRAGGGELEDNEWGDLRERKRVIAKGASGAIEDE